MVIQESSVMVRQEKYVSQKYIEAQIRSNKWLLFLRRQALRSLCKASLVQEEVACSIASESFCFVEKKRRKLMAVCIWSVFVDICSFENK